MNRSKIYLTHSEKAQLDRILEESKEALSKKDLSGKRPSQIIKAVFDSVRTRIERELVLSSQK